MDPIKPPNNYINISTPLNANTASVFDDKKVIICQELQCVNKIEHSALKIIKKSAMVNFIDLPKEILQSICSYNNLFSMGSIASASTLFNKLMYENLYWMLVVNQGFLKPPAIILERFNYLNFVKNECLANWKLSNEEFFCLKILSNGITNLILKASFENNYVNLSPNFLLTSCRSLELDSNLSAPYISMIKCCIEKDSDFRKVLNLLNLNKEMNFIVRDEHQELSGQTFTGCQLFDIGNKLLVKLENKVKRIAENNQLRLELANLKNIGHFHNRSFLA